MKLFWSMMTLSIVFWVIACYFQDTFAGIIALLCVGTAICCLIEKQEREQYQ